MIVIITVPLTHLLINNQVTVECIIFICRATVKLIYISLYKSVMKKVILALVVMLYHSLPPPLHLITQFHLCYQVC